MRAAFRTDNLEVQVSLVVGGSVWLCVVLCLYVLGKCGCEKFSSW